MSIRDDLAAPFDNVQWRLQQTQPKDAKKPYPAGTRGLFMAYIDARQLYDRLDAVLGIGNWQRIVKAVNPDGSVIGCLRVKIDNEWIEHEDIGYSNNPGAPHEAEPLKAAASDAFNRAGVGLGIGRFLYDLDADWRPVDSWGKPLAGDQPPPRVDAHQAQPEPAGRTQPAQNGERPTIGNPSAPASQKQIDFISGLAKDCGYVVQGQDGADHLDEVGFAGYVGAAFQSDWPSITKGTASALIEQLQAERNERRAKKPATQAPMLPADNAERWRA